MKVITARAIVLYLYGLDLPVQPWPAHAVVWPADAVAVGCRCEYNTKSG